MRSLTLNTGVPVPQLGLGVWPLTDAQAYDAVSHALTAGYLGQTVKPPCSNGAVTRTLSAAR
ncbi:hypothetical protein [Streptomyces cyaneofuscatus]|uniref:hypothetical protein n=1 Tax=Streptomyces cyaneofuscatus TaxID=66883 RepID=UPI0036CE4677